MCSCIATIVHKHNKGSKNFQNMVNNILKWWSKCFLWPKYTIHPKNILNIKFSFAGRLILQYLIWKHFWGIMLLKKQKKLLIITLYLNFVGTEVFSHDLYLWFALCTYKTWEIPVFPFNSMCRWKKLARLKRI